MSGVPGAGGPVPKRSAQRRRVNKPAVPITTGAARPVVRPEPDPDWHPLAGDWYCSLGTSGQQDFFQDSDWQTARVWAQVLSNQLNAGARMSAVMMQSWSSANGELLATEGSRRRMRLELERLPVVSGGPDAVEDELDRHRQQRTGAGSPARDAAGRFA